MKKLLLALVLLLPTTLYAGDKKEVITYYNEQQSGNSFKVNGEKSTLDFGTNRAMHFREVWIIQSDRLGLDINAWLFRSPEEIDELIQALEASKETFK